MMGEKQVLTPFELSMYLAQQQDPDSCEYNINLMFEIEGADRPSITDALAGLVRNHEALRSRFSADGGTPVRIITNEIPNIRWTVCGDIDVAMEQIRAGERPFSLDEVPIRCVGYELPDKKVLLHIAIHHIIIDGASLDIITEELFFRLTGGPVTESSVDLSQLDNRFSNENDESKIDFYREMFRDGVPVAELPIKGKRPPAHPGVDSRKEVWISGNKMDHLITAAKASGATVFEYLLSAASMVIAKYCNSDDIVLGIPTNMRDEESAHVVGMLVNTVPLRIKPEAGKSLPQFIKEVSATVKGAVRDNNVPLSHLIKAMRVAADPSKSPLFDVGVNYFRLPPRYSNGRVSIDFSYDLQKMKRDMNFVIYRGESDIHIILQYVSVFFDDAFIDRFLEQLLYTLDLMTEHSDAILSEVTVLPENQQEELQELSVTAECEIPDQLLHHIFEKAVESDPDRTALIACDRALTFRELNEEANRVAHSLLARGIRTGDSVVLLLPRRSFYFTALFGVLKSGAVFIPCDPAYPDDRIRFIVEDSGTTFIITDQDRAARFKERVPDTPDDMLLLIDDLKQSDQTGNPCITMPEDALAYMIYTSGSTGRPKGVMLRHLGICNFVTRHPANILYEAVNGRLDVMLAVTTVSFDLSLKDTLGVLANSKTVVFADEDEMNDPKALTRLIEQTGADAINATPSRYLQYLAYEPFARAISQFSLVMAGGEPFPQQLLSRLQQTTTAMIINTYGPTETTISSNMADLTNADHVTVGPPLLNVCETITDHHGNPTPRGAVGELRIGGLGVAAGYRGLPEQNAQRFVDGGRVFRTGDYARWTEDGTIEILGRMDGQIKLRGLRIELGEIEAVMEEFEGIRKAVAAVKEIDGTEYLCAYYVSDGDLDESGLLDHMKQKLTAYMVPRALMRIDSIPVSTNGKTDRKALPVPQYAKADDDMTPPSTETEKRIFEIVSKETGIDEFGIKVAFAELGITSLSMVGLMLAISDAFRKPINIRDIKEHDTIFALAGFLDRDSSERIYEMREEYPLTQTQYGIYVECLKNTDTTIYNIPIYFKLGSSVDINRLQKAIITAIDAHPYIKLRLVEGEDAVYARRHDAAPVEVRRVNQDHLPTAQELIRPYDMLQDTLYRMEIYETPEGNAFYMELHHIVGDGESRLILQRDIERAYAGEEIMPERFTGYEVALAEEEDRQGEAFNRARQWYERTFSDAESGTLPPAQPEKDAGTLVGSVMRTTGLDANRLEDFCRKNHITLSTLFNAAYGYTLSVYAYSGEAVFTTIYHGRDDSRLANSVTMLVKTIPVRVNPEPQMSTRDFLLSLHRQLEHSIDNTVYSFGEISRSLGIRAETMLAFQGKGLSVGATMDFCGDRAEVSRPALSAPKTALTAEVYVDGDSILLRGEYATQSFDHDFTDGFLKCLEQSARELSEKETLGEISLMYEGAWEPYDRVNKTEVPVALMSVNKLFERQVALHSDKTAVIAAGERLTFDELNRLANRVAHGLIDLGVGRDDIVGMVFDRTRDIFIAEHGILKSGGAFLPMVPEYPDERINYCLLNAESPCVITTEAIKASRPELFSDDQPYQTLTVEALIQKPGDENPDLDIPLDSLAYCIYTSGSTGNPKGVMIEHRNMCNYLNANPRHPAIYWHTVYNHAALSVTSISFDMSITERFVSLCNGVTICMATLEEIHNPRALARLMMDNHTESIVCTPSYLMSLLDEPDMLPAIAALKAYHVGGEAFPSTLIDRLKELNPGSHVMNGYGPTETSVCCTSSEILPGRPITIGKPEANVTHYVVDRQLRPVPKGVCGELIICGAGVGRGYVKLPDKTRAAFFTFRGAKAYHSGDLVRLNDEGEYDYYGRLDNQVKLRGLRIELDEIETVIREYPGVRLSKVIVRNNGKEDYLAGFYTGECEIPVKDLKKYLKSRLTPYMVPEAMVQLSEMPLTINGKIDQKKLPDIANSDETREYETPANEYEELFCGIFAKVLKQDRVGATDDFFEIGGTSLSAAMVVSNAVRSGYDVVYQNIFEYPTPRRLAAFVMAAGGVTHAAPQASEKREKAPAERFSSVLDYNRPENLRGIASAPLGSVLLTGTTGFLGLYVLRELLNNPGVDKIYCLIRDKGDISAISRLKHLLMYYFADNFDELVSGVENKAVILNADITDAHLHDALSDIAFDVMINCAAVVKHFETGNLIHRVNYEGVLNLIDVALVHKARLVQISTLSIAGGFLGEAPSNAVLREYNCDMGQTPATKYSIAKFEAEQAVLEAMEQKGLKAKIIRVGNLMGRSSDGEFQINFNTNGFMNRLKAYMVMGCFPVGMMDSVVEFSPIDTTARVVVLLAGTDDRFTVFHANNCHTFHFANVLEAFENCGYHVEIVEDDIFKERFSEALEDEARSITVSSLASYNTNAGEQKTALPTDNSFTVKALYRLGFSWPIIAIDYLEKLIEALATLDFFGDCE